MTYNVFSGTLNPTHFTSLSYLFTYLFAYLWCWQSVNELYELAEQIVLRTPEGCKELLSVPDN